MNPIKRAVEFVGGISNAARLCKVSSRAVNKWISAGRLPRTEYTGETHHADNLAAGSNGHFSAAWLREASLAFHAEDESDTSDYGTSSSALNVPVRPSSTQQAYQ
jgi:hypothetical protein